MVAKTSARLLVGLGCNLDCSYCCNKSPAVRSQFFTGYTTATIRYHEYRDICISGGEPLLYLEKVWDIVARAKYAGCNSYLYTNGTLLTQDRLKRLLKAGVHCVNVSLHDGPGFEEQLEYIHNLYIHNLKRWHPAKVRISVPEGVNVPPYYVVRRFTIKAGVDCISPNEDIYLLKD